MKMKHASDVQEYNITLKIINYSLLLCAVIAILTPVFLVFNASFKSSEEYFNNSILSLARNFLNFDNYILVVDKGNLILGFRNTFILIAISVSGSVIMGTMVAYVLGRFDFRFKKLLINAFLLAVVIPSVTTQVATFTLIKNLHLYNTIFAGIVLYLATDIVQIYIFLQFINNIPFALDESAMIEGSSYFKIYRSILLPQMKPAIATVIILKVLSIYNDMLVPYLYMPKTSLRTITIAIMNFFNNRNAQWNVMSAGIFAVLLPTMVLYLYLQKYIFAGVSMGAVKE